MIPADWPASLAPAAAGVMTATVSLRHPGGTRSTDPDTGVTTTVPRAAYASSVPARVQALQAALSGGTVDAADEQLQVAGYLVTVPFDRGDLVATGDLVTVSASSDPLLTGRVLLVVDIIRGSMRVERDLICHLTD